MSRDEKSWNPYTYLRSIMSEERLSDLSMMLIENEHARKLDILNLVDIIAQEKARKPII